MTSKDSKIKDVCNKLDGKKKKWRMKWCSWDSENLIEAVTEREAWKIVEKSIEHANASNRGDIYFCDEIEEIEG